MAVQSNYLSPSRTPEPSHIDVPDHSRITQAKVVKAACYSLGTLGSIGGVMSLFSQDKKPLSLPLFIASSGLVYFAWNLKDYQNSQELEDMRRTAEKQSFSQVKKEHGLLNITRYTILTPELLQVKFRRQYAHIPLSKILKKYTFSDIQKHNLIPQVDLRYLLFDELASTRIVDLKSPFLNECFNGNILSEEEIVTFQKLCVQASDLLVEKTNGLTTIDQQYSKRTSKLLRETNSEAIKEYILKSGIGIDHEERYQKEIKQINENYEKKLRDLQTQFEEIVNAYKKSDSLSY